MRMQIFSIKMLTQKDPTGAITTPWKYGRSSNAELAKLHNLLVYHRFRMWLWLSGSLHPGSTAMDHWKYIVVSLESSWITLTLKAEPIFLLFSGTFFTTYVLVFGGRLLWHNQRPGFQAAKLPENKTTTGVKLFFCGVPVLLWTLGFQLSANIGLEDQFAMIIFVKFCKRKLFVFADGDRTIKLNSYGYVF